jgi:hypothetical protein
MLVERRKLPLVFDLDETLMQAKQLEFHGSKEFQYDSRASGQWGRSTVYMAVPEAARTMLRNLAPKFDIYALTAGDPWYCKAVIQQIDPDETVFKKGQSCRDPGPDKRYHWRYTKPKKFEMIMPEYNCADIGGAGVCIGVDNDMNARDGGRYDNWENKDMHHVVDVANYEPAVWERGIYLCRMVSNKVNSPALLLVYIL